MPKESTSDTEVERGGGGHMSTLASDIETRVRYWTAKETCVRLDTINALVCLEPMEAAIFPETYVHRFNSSRLGYWSCKAINANNY